MIASLKQEFLKINMFIVMNKLKQRDKLKYFKSWRK